MTTRTITARMLDAGSIVILPNGEPRTVAAVDDTPTHVYLDWADGGSGIYAHGDTVTIADNGYFSDLTVIRAAGRAHALDCMRNGQTEPDDALFSGEWADGLTGQDALRYAGLTGVTFSELDDFEQTDVLDSFEAGYLNAPWPALKPAPRTDPRAFHAVNPDAEQD